MSKPFDATLNMLIDGHEANWAGYFGARAGIAPGPATSLDTDLSSTLQADRLFRIDGPTSAVLHLELESSGKLGRPAQLLRYNVAAWGTTGLPVHSVLIILRPKANATDLTGQFGVPDANGKPYLIFEYTVVRLWRESIDVLLNAGPGVAPLALLTDEAAADLSAAFARFRDRLRSEGIPDSVERVLLESTFILGGLRYSSAQIENLYLDLNMTLEDSTTYQLILNKGITQGRAQGRVEEARRMVLRLAVKRFGPTPSNAEAAILAISDHDRLERMVDRVHDAAGWDDLLATS
ncbi:MAG TPA: hypothetical protein VG122_21620 [Gemmata sp.]|jgi:hypothetical protein|nr:hypothetical protein [Gemmata sp.]